jgi:hypothetical protein
MRKGRFNPAERPTALDVAQSVPKVEKKQNENVNTALRGIAGLAVLGLFSAEGTANLTAHGGQCS